MADKVQKEFVQSFIRFLRRPCTFQPLSLDSKESIDVAIQCLQTAFDIDDASDLEATGSLENGSDMGQPNKTLIDLFEVFQSLYIERSPEVAQIAETLKNEGNRLMKDGKYNEALLQYNRAISFDPKNPIYYCNRAAAYIRLNYNENAVTDCKTALLYNPTYSKAYGRLGIAYSNLKKYSEAQQAYEKAIELEPDNRDYRNNLEVARDASQVRNTIPQITEGINTMLSTPAIRNIFNNADVDLEQLQMLSQNPVVMNAVSQLFAGMPANSGDANSSPLLPNGMLQLFQSFANQLSSAQDDGNSNETFNANPDSRPPAP
ncbi:small glutamine-rich tetratricopeptide repeat-containing protein alpha [Anastrepha obliqua]|uniref:small glutamine-rich tetratricopeptide repeat-containing protein alpha n=1 Tax=Anastrepha obliqua TaxID=95512 RepID=UPI002409C609|nr:small glutamine-rich tetratricopeptide repeat-containing protein alpha [Anastrepha obliqua]